MLEPEAPERRQESRRLAVSLNALLLVAAGVLVGRDAFHEALLSKRMRFAAGFGFFCGVVADRLILNR